ncbi:adenylyl-sulfate kinase, partial [Paraburkholderia aspalathi]|uniref:adenylyl-sulfate kinase n=1 Tax=Paraburkholderia aspalathi TaxID=1324617 RepID=UPI00190B2C68
ARSTRPIPFLVQCATPLVISRHIARDANPKLGRDVTLLDGDHLRRGLNNDLDFSDASRHESIRRAAEVARLIVDAGIVVIASLISPFRADRDAARALFASGQFFEVHVDAPFEIVEARDVKGLYKKAREGLLPKFTGIDSPYEPPIEPELRLNTAELTPQEGLQRILLAVDSLGADAGEALAQRLYA